jgi:6-phosphofructokinase 2
MAVAEIGSTRIVTLTMNPAVDLSTAVTRMAPFTKMRCAAGHRDPGGGGINVARVLNRLGIDATAIYPAGGATGQLLRTLVEREAVRSIVIPAQNETREDVTVLDETTHEQFRFVFPGAALSDIEWQDCLASIGRIVPAPALVIASGSLPPGVPENFFGLVARACKGHSKVIVDTSGPRLKAALEHGIYLIKPNLHEFLELAGISASDDATLIEAARDLIGRGQTEIVALSMGPEGALLITRDLALRASGLPIEPVSVSGAGDSFLGAMVWSLVNDGGLETALRYAVAGGSAALLSPGTELCLPADVHRLVTKVIVRTVVHPPPLRVGS